MSRIIDADSHFMEPLDLWERYIEPKYRSRCLRFERESDGNYAMLLDGNRTTGLGEFTIRELLGVAVGYGQKEEGHNLTSFDPSAIFSHSLEDMDKRAAFLDHEGIESQFIYPVLGGWSRKSGFGGSTLSRLQQMGAGDVRRSPRQILPRWARLNAQSIRSCERSSSSREEWHQGGLCCSDADRRQELRESRV